MSNCPMVHCETLEVVFPTYLDTQDGGEGYGSHGTQLHRKCTLLSISRVNHSFLLIIIL